MTYGNYPDLSLIQRVLVIKMRHHGDVLLTSPLFSQLKKSLPWATIDAFLYKDTLPMLEGHPAISHYLLYDRGYRRHFFKKMAHEVALLKKVRASHYDLVINLTEGDRGAITARFAKARYRVGFDPKGAGLWGKRNLYTQVVKTCALPRHTVERQLDALRCIGIFPTPEERDLYLHIPKEATDRIQTLLAQEGVHSKEVVVIHPVSRWRFKCIATKQMAEVLIDLHSRHIPVILTAGHDPQEIAMVQEILSLAPGVRAFNWAGKLTLKELSALISSARALLCVDSVPLHIASATKTPVVTLFGPTSELNWGPWMHPKARVVTNPFSCRPCFQDGCGGSKMSDCLFSIPPKKILASLEEVLLSV